MKAKRNQERVPATMNLLTQMKQWSPATKKQAWVIYDHYAREFKRLADEKADPAGIAAGVHDAIDEQIAETAAKDSRAQRVTCRRGCNACCRLHVTVTRPEAALLAKVIAEAVQLGIDIDRDRLRRQAGHASVEAWRELPHVDRLCVFNDGSTGDCQIYEHRPSSCRKYQVVSDPALCDTSTGVHEVGILANGHAELIDSAAMGAFGMGTLPDLLLEALSTTERCA